MKCPECALTDGNHDRACWQWQVTRLATSLKHLLLVVQNVDNMTHGGFDASYGAKKAAESALEMLRKRDNRTEVHKTL